MVAVSGLVLATSLVPIPDGDSVPTRADKLLDAVGYAAITFAAHMRREHRVGGWLRGVAGTRAYITPEARAVRALSMLKHATVIDATTGRSSRIGVQTPDDEGDEDEQRARGVGWLRAVRRWFGV
ncbi:hypothetical protein [Halobacterium salinarum]|uniref:hypothetical protein n=1 Tax=Halobacterium salinarum TaxID=2242 RepID=UPI001F2B047A|nr:hypothetical protein [Halobacterium salinarum]